MKLYEPWPDGYTINARSPYGPRKRHPITGKTTFHHGVDVAMPTGTQLTAPADGVVVHKNRTASAGYNLILRHEGTWHTVYYHLQKHSPLAMGAEVKAGELLGWSGNTGMSTGPHLHFELRNTRTWGDSRDPVPHFVGKYKAPAPEPIPEPTPEPEPVAPKPKPKPETIPKPTPKPVAPTPEPVEPEPVTPVERPTIKPTPRPEPVTPKPRPTWHPPMKPLTMTKRLQDWFDMKRHLR